MTNEGIDVTIKCPEAYREAVKKACRGVLSGTSGLPPEKLVHASISTSLFRAMAKHCLQMLSLTDRPLVAMITPEEAEELGIE